MQLMGSKIVIRDYPIQQQQYQALIPERELTQLQNNQKVDIQELSTPIVSVLFGYKAGVQFQGFVFQLELEFSSKGERVSYKQLQYKSTNNYLLRVIEIDSSICYQKTINISATIKYVENEHYHQISSVKQLCSLLSKRQFVIYNEKILTSYKREILIKQPIYTQYRYSPLGYVWLKCTNKNNEIVINKIQLVNWLVSNHDVVKKFQSKSSLVSPMQMKKKEEIAVMISAPKSLGKLNIPYVLEYCFKDIPEHPFKMIKYLCL